jgi:hypothetical protein
MRKMPDAAALANAAAFIEDGSRVSKVQDSVGHSGSGLFSSRFEPAKVRLLSVY